MCEPFCWLGQEVPIDIQKTSFRVEGHSPTRVSYISFQNLLSRLHKKQTLNKSDPLCRVTVSKWQGHPPNRTNFGSPSRVNKCLYMEAPPEVQSMSLLQTIFPEKGAPLVYLLSTNCTTFIYLVQNFTSFVTAVNALCVKQESLTKIERFLDFITS